MKLILRLEQIEGGLAELRGVNAEFFMKNPAKVERGTETQLKTDLLDDIVRMQ